ncbi:probable pectinesterase/pectinesterase inhibitor 7 isoform X1 [Cucurbita moschata]|uniref:Pectinesterase n=2 Tax=Cucurbita moschata TaxID=3662 RepID=A0A6J1GK92_CUCMO|nr:probable pectinesterase/pectinesterase inhibitor 7 isoform X1 [Cucurbita moschata]
MAFFQRISCFFLCFLNFLAVVDSTHFNATVALDGTGNFKSITDAIAAAPNNSNTRFYIRVSPGIYHEHLEIASAKKFIALIGENEFTTIIVDNRSNAGGFRTSESATMVVKGNNFMAQHLSFENSADHQDGQAVAVLDDAKYTVYYKCRFLSFQDTLYSKGEYQFFKGCDIYGTVDFIFGNGLAMFQDCNVYARLPSNDSTVTAQSKKQWTQSGFSFQNCTVTVSPEIASCKALVKIYLGRPWKPYSTVVFMESFLDDNVQPQGWMLWPGVPVNNLFYAEYNNRGPGANTTHRVNWPGFHVIDRQLAKSFTVENFINGTYWLPETNVPYTSGLYS